MTQSIKMSSTAPQKLQVCFILSRTCEPVNIKTGRSSHEVGDIVIMTDNFSSHHYEGGEILEEGFNMIVNSLRLHDGFIKNNRLVSPICY